MSIKSFLLAAAAACAFFAAIVVATAPEDGKIAIAMPMKVGHR